jgi:hypothetical protein
MWFQFWNLPNSQEPKNISIARAFIFTSPEYFIVAIILNTELLMNMKTAK